MKIKFLRTQNRFMIIGIGGVSRAGKTELSNFLFEKFRLEGIQVVVIHQDDFVHPTDFIPKIKDRIDWENPQSINFSKYITAIQEAQKSGADIIIAEGIFNFYEKEVQDLFDKKIFVEISRTTFEKRKAEDHRWGYEPDWYIEHIWNSYEQFGQTILENKSNILKVSGENQASYSKVWEYVFLEKKERFVSQR